MTTGDVDKDQLIDLATTLSAKLGGTLGEVLDDLVVMLRTDDPALCLCGSLLACPIHPGQGGWA